jgi:DHA3 family macrolide efflux protein-like MFS transporter
MCSETIDVSQENPVIKKSLAQYLLLWTGQQISMLGSSIVHFSVVWWLTIETGSSSIVSIASICFYIPVLILGPFAGVIADRVSRKKILLISDFIQALLTLVLILFFIFNIYRIWHVILLISLRAICGAFQFPVNLAIVPSMVPQEQLSRMNTLNQIFTSINQIASPALGALLFNIWTIQQIYWIDVFSFIPAAIILFLIKIPRARITQIAQKPLRKSFISDFKEGFMYIIDSKLIWFIILLMLSNFFNSPIFNLFSIFVYEIHHGTEEIYALTQIFFYGGLFLVSLILMLKKMPPSLKYVIIGRFIYSSSLLLLGVVPEGIIWAIYALNAIIGAVLSILEIQTMGVFQKLIPRELAGRVFSTSLVLVKVSLPIGLIIMGYLGDSINLRWVFIGSSALSIISIALIFIFSPLIQIEKNREKTVPSGEVRNE